MFLDRTVLLDQVLVSSRTMKTDFFFFLIHSQTDTHGFLLNPPARWSQWGTAGILYFSSYHSSAFQIKFWMQFTQHDTHFIEKKVSNRFYFSVTIKRQMPIQNLSLFFSSIFFFYKRLFTKCFLSCLQNTENSQERKKKVWLKFKWNIHQTNVYSESLVKQHRNAVELGMFRLSSVSPVLCSLSFRRPEKQRGISCELLAFSPDVCDQVSQKHWNEAKDILWLQNKTKLDPYPSSFPFLIG